jgi:hypothetical protein
MGIIVEYAERFKMMSLGTKPRSGGRPPIESRDKNISIFQNLGTEDIEITSFGEYILKIIKV